MRVHVVSDVYPPEPTTSAGIARDIATEMARRGHETTVFAPFPNRPSGKLFDNHRRSWRKVVSRDGYKIIYSWHTLSKRSTLMSRLAENISYGLTSTLQLMREPVADVVYMNTWPIFAQWLNAFTLSRQGVPVVCAVKDLYPESFVGTGQIGGKNPLIPFAQFLDNQVYKNCALVAPLNSVAQDYLITTRKIAKNKVYVIQDWVNASAYQSNRTRLNEFRQQYALSPDLFVAMFVGSLTRMAGLELYVQAAEILRHRQDIKILLVGDGAMREPLEKIINQKGLRNIQIIYPLQPENVPEVQAASDVLMLSLLPGAADHATPSKLIFYMYSQRPVIASVKHNGPPARIIHEAQCGYVVPQGNPQALAERLEKMADDPIANQQFGDRARRYAEAHYSIDSVLPRVCQLLESLPQSRQHLTTQMNAEGQSAFKDILKQ